MYQFLNFIRANRFPSIGVAVALFIVGSISLQADPALLVANPSYYSVPENLTLNVGAATGVLHNAYSSNGVLTAYSYSQVAHGTVNLNITGSFTYTPTTGYVGPDSFLYFISNGSTTTSATCNITVYHPAPIALPDVYGTLVNQTLTVPIASGVLSNDVCFLGTSHATSYSQTTHGLVNVGIAGNFTYQPNPGYVGTDSFNYFMSDGVTTANSTVTLVVAGVPPVLNDDYYSVRAGKALTVPIISGVLSNDLPIMGSLHATSYSQTTHGLVNVGIAGDFTYQPDPGYVGTDSFTYFASNGYLETNATVTLIVEDNPPVAEPDYFHVLENNTLTVTAANGLLMNDLDPDNDAIHATSFSQTSHGSLNVSLDGSLIYTPDTNYIGADTFSYYITDGVLTASATATIHVFSPRGGTSINNDYYAAAENGTLTVAANKGLLQNDYGNGSALSVNSPTVPAHGTLKVNPDGSFTYTPTTGYLGPDAFTYYVTVGLLNLSATCNITMYHPAPIALPDVYGVLINHILNVPISSGVLSNDLSFIGTSHATSFSQPAHGLASMGIAGDFTYQPDAGYIGTDSFTYYISDGVSTANSTVTLIVAGTPPVVNNDYYYVHAGKTLAVPISSGVLSNDLPIMGSIYAYSYSQTTHGIVNLGIAGDFTYQPNPGYIGTDSFTYFARNGYLQSNATVTITVVDNPPVAEPDYFHVHQNGTLTVAATNGLLLNDFDPDQDPLTVVTNVLPAHGSVVVKPDGSLTYIPTPGFVGNDIFGYTVSDGTFSQPGMVNIQVTAIPRGLISHIGVTRTNVVLTCVGLPAATFDVQRATNLLSLWLTLFTTNAPATGIFNYTDSNPPKPAAFYRLYQH